MNGFERLSHGKRLKPRPESGLDWLVYDHAGLVINKFSQLREEELDFHSARPVHLTITMIRVDSDQSVVNEELSLEPQKALCGGFSCPFLEPLARSWSHFVGIYRQNLTRSVEN